MPSESVKIIFELNGTNEAASAVDFLSMKVDKLTQLQRDGIPAQHEAREALESLKDRTEEYADVLDQADIPSALDAIADSAGKVGLAIGAFAGGVAIGTQIGDLLAGTEKWNALLEVTLERSARLQKQWEDITTDRFRRDVAAAGDDINKLNEMLKGPDITGAIERKEKEIRRLEKLIPEIARLEAAPFGEFIASTIVPFDARAELETRLKEQDVLKKQRSELQELIRTIPGKKLEEEREEIEKTQAQWGKFFDFVSGKAKNFITEQTQVRPFQLAVEEGLKAEKEAERESKRERRGRIASLRKEMAELNRTSRSPQLTGRDDRLGSGRGNPFATVVASNERIAAERRQQLEEMIAKLEAIQRNTNKQFQQVGD